MKKLKYLIFFLTFCIVFVPRETYAEDFYTGAYITYYQDSNLQTPHLGAYGVYFKNFNSYNANTSNFIDTWYYTTQLDTTNIQGGSIYIPYTISHNVLTASTPTYSNNYQCSYWDCTSSGNSTTCTCGNYSIGSEDDYEFYSSDVSLIIRCYYNGSVTFVPGRVEGSNIICPVNHNATYLYGIRIFHRMIGATSFQYSLGLAAGVTTYTNSSTQIIEKQEETTDAINDMNNNITNSSTNGNNISGATSDIENMIPQDEKSQGFYNNIFTFYNRVNESIDTTCSNYTLELMGKTIVFPCINMAGIFGDWWTIIDILCCIWPLLNIFNLIIGWVDGITDLEDMSYFKSAKHVHWSREDYRKGMYY